MKVVSSNFKFQFGPLKSVVADLLRYSTFDILRSSSIGGRLHFNQVLILGWCPELKFKNWGRSDQGLN